MPLRVLDLASRLGLAPDCVLIEARDGGCRLEMALPEVPERAAPLLVERIRSMIPVGTAELDDPRELSRENSASCASSARARRSRG